jgi:molecular chaperone GrpE
MSDEHTTDAAPADDAPVLDVGVDAGPAGIDPVDETSLTVEGLLDDLDRVTAERDAFLDDSRRIAADFANFRRQTEKRNADLVEQANARLVENLLPTLDACEAAVQHGTVGVEALQAALLAVLEREGLARVRPDGEAFDPALHEAVLHEPADETDADGPVVVEVLRTGYQLNGRVIRPALVKVRG